MHVDEAGVLVEGIAVDGVGGFLRGEDEDGTGFGCGVVGFGWSKGRGCESIIV